MVERGSVKASLFDSASNFLLAQRSEEERKKLGELFVQRARKMLVDYGPKMKVRQHDRNYAYPYIEPGIRSTPPIVLKTPDDGEINMYVEGKFKKDTTPDIHPDSVKLKSLSLRLKSDGKSDDFTIAFDNKGNPNPALLPSNESLQKGLDLLQIIKDGYEKQRLKQNPGASYTGHG